MKNDAKQIHQYFPSQKTPALTSHWLGQPLVNSLAHMLAVCRAEWILATQGQSCSFQPWTIRLVCIAMVKKNDKSIDRQSLLQIYLMISYSSYPLKCSQSSFLILIVRKGTPKGKMANLEMTLPINIFERGQVICSTVFLNCKVILEGRDSVSQWTHSERL